jgi:hypothetical protein
MERAKILIEQQMATASSSKTGNQRKTIELTSE